MRAIFATFAFLFLGTAPCLGQPREKVRILVVPTALDHPWNSHMYDHECKLLVRCLNQNPGVEAFLSPDLDWPKDPKVLEGVGSIVFYS